MLKPGDELEGRAQIAGQGIPIELSTEEDVDIPLVRLNNAVVAKETRLSQQRPSTPWRAAAGMRRFHHGAGVGGQPTGIAAAIPRAIRVWL